MSIANRFRVWSEVRAVTKVLWWSNYLTSWFAGLLIVPVVAVMGYRVRWRLIDVTARDHADRAARRDGPYLAPVTLVGILFILAAVSWWWIS